MFVTAQTSGQETFIDVIGGSFCSLEAILRSLKQTSHFFFVMTRFLLPTCFVVNYDIMS